MMDADDAVGEVIASFMKRDTLDHYRRERDQRIRLDDPTCTGHYEGCLSEAEEFIERLRTRGYDVVPRRPAEPTP
jgi:hypothetical protein